MSTKRRFSIAKEGKSPSKEAMSRTYNRAIANGGVTQDFNANVENIRELSRKIGYDVLQDAKFLYVPSSYGESKNFTQNPSIRNLFRFSEDFTAGFWVKTQSVITPNANLNPFGVNKSYYLTENTVSSSHYLVNNFVNYKQLTYTFSYYVKKADHTWCQFALAIATFSANVWINFNFDTGLFGNSGSQGIWNVTPSANGYYLITVTANALNSGNDNLAVIIGTNNTNSVGRLPSYLGVGANICDVAAMQMEQSPTVTTYQRTTDGISDFTFTRATSSTTTNKLGVIEDSCYNKLLNSTWSGGGVGVAPTNWSLDTTGGTLTPVTSILNNGGTAYKFTTANQQLKLVQQFQLITNYTYYFSFYTESVTIATPNLYNVMAFGGGNLGVHTYYEDGVQVPATGYAIKAGKWYTLKLEATITTSSRFIQIGLATTNTAATGDMILSSPQMTIGGEGFRPYLKTTDRLNVPCLDYSSTTVVARRNMMNNTEDIDTLTWGKTELIITPNLIVDPKGFLSADKLIPTIVSAIHRITQPSIPVINGSTYTLTWYQKSGEYFSTRTNLSDNITSANTTFNSNTGVISNIETTVINATMVLQSNGWYKCSITRIVSNTLVSILFTVVDAVGATAFTGDGVSGIYIWGTQLELGTATEYQAVNNNQVAQIKNEPSLMIEPQRTNLVLQSENIVAFSATNTTVTLNSNTNPFGTNKSYYLNDGLNDGTHFIFHGSTIISGNTYTSSFYVKKADDTWCQFTMFSTTFGTDVWKNFNFDTGLFGNGGSTGVWTAKQIVNGYWLITATATAIASSTNATNIVVGTNNTNSATRVPTYIGTNRNFADVAAMQSEVGSNATSYIPTTTATVQRNRDSSYVDLSNNNMLNKDNFTLYCEGWLYEGESSNTSIALSDSTRTGAYGNDLGWFLGVRPIYGISGVVTNPGGTVPLIVNNSYKFVIQRIGDQVRFFRNGIEIWSVQTIPVVDYKYLTVNGISTYSVDKIALFNRALSFVECINLCSPTYTFEEMANANNYTLIF